jgi:hypothetical protein
MGSNDRSAELRCCLLMKQRGEKRKVMVRFQPRTVCPSLAAGRSPRTGPPPSTCRAGPVGPHRAQHSGRYSIERPGPGVHVRAVVRARGPNPAASALRLLLPRHASFPAGRGFYCVSQHSPPRGSPRRLASLH